MSQTTLSVRMDEDLKRRFDAFCSDVGMNASVAVNLFARAVVREQRIPFEITTEPFWSIEIKSPCAARLHSWMQARERRTN